LGKLEEIFIETSRFDFIGWWSRCTWCDYIARNMWL